MLVTMDTRSNLWPESGLISEKGGPIRLPSAVPFLYQYNCVYSYRSMPPSDYFEKYVTQYAYIAIGILGMSGNLFVLVVFFSVPAMRKKLTNIYIINQSCIDFVVSF